MWWFVVPLVVSISGNRLHDAARANDVDGLEHLITTGLEDCDCDPTGCSPCTLDAYEARSTAFQPTRECLVTALGELTAPGDAVTEELAAQLLGLPRHDPKIINFLERHPECVPTTEDGFTAVMVAARQGHVEALRVLVGSGADINIQHDSGMTAVMLAVQQNNPLSLELLLHAGATPNSRMTVKGVSAGWTPLMVAADGGFTECIKVLTESGADIDARADSVTALMLAASGGHHKVLTELIAAGADVMLEDREADTALDRAEDCSKCRRVLTAAAAKATPKRKTKR